MSGHHLATVRRAGRKRGARCESSEALAEQPAVARSAVEVHECCARVSRTAALVQQHIDGVARASSAGTKSGSIAHSLKRTVGGPATARRRSELGNRGRLRHGQLSSPWRSGRRFANFQRQRGPAGPPISVFCAKGTPYPAVRRGPSSAAPRTTSGKSAEERVTASAIWPASAPAGPAVTRSSRISDAVAACARPPERSAASTSSVEAGPTWVRVRVRVRVRARARVRARVRARARARVRVGVGVRVRVRVRVEAGPTMFLAAMYARPCSEMSRPAASCAASRLPGRGVKPGGRPEASTPAALPAALPAASARPSLKPLATAAHEAATSSKSSERRTARSAGNVRPSSAASDVSSASRGPRSALAIASASMKSASTLTRRAHIAPSSAVAPAMSSATKASSVAVAEVSSALFTLLTHAGSGTAGGGGCGGCGGGACIQTCEARAAAAAAGHPRVEMRQC
eukprot:scaffold8935_cov69-Phaeocystis_antarctica.AAC.7